MGLQVWIVLDPMLKQKLVFLSPSDDSSQTGVAVLAAVIGLVGFATTTIAGGQGVETLQTVRVSEIMSQKLK